MDILKAVCAGTTALAGMGLSWASLAALPYASGEFAPLILSTTAAVGVVAIGLAWCLARFN